MDNWTSSNVIDVLATIFAGISILLVCYQIRENLKWNRKKCAEEALTRFISGDFFKYVDRLESQFGWSILKESNKYEDVIKDLQNDKRQELDNILKDVFRYFETVTIKIEHKVIDEEVCFDYLFSVLTSFHLKCESFVKKVREARKEPRIFEHVTFYGDKWHKRCAKGKRTLRMG